MIGRSFGLGLRAPHHQYVLENLPKVDFFEIHTENFICEGGPSLNFLEQIAKHYKLSFHSVGLSLGSTSPIDKEHLANTKKLLDIFKPMLFSDHLSWSNSGNKGVANDLLPVPYTKESLQLMCDNIKYVQDYLGREMLVENPSAYLEFAASEMEEVDFLNELAHKAGCGILLDINNVFVSSCNFNFDASSYLQKISLAKVKEIHLAGHSIIKQNNAEVRIDTHSTHICQEVLDLFKNFIKTNNLEVPVLIEWDEDIPEFGVLYKELEKVRGVV